MFVVVILRLKNPNFYQHMHCHHVTRYYGAYYLQRLCFSMQGIYAGAYPYSSIFYVFPFLCLSYLHILCHHFFLNTLLLGAFPRVYTLGSSCFFTVIRIVKYGWWYQIIQIKFYQAFSVFHSSYQKLCKGAVRPP